MARRRRERSWRRPPLPIALMLGYAGFFRDVDTGRLRIWVEPTDREIDALIVESEAPGLEDQVTIPV